MLLFICGFMGSGKTHLMEKLKKNPAGYECLDLDREILEKFSDQYHLLGELIEERGWDFFRQQELVQIKLLCQQDTASKQVISLGGGALSDSSLAVIKKAPDAHLFWIKTPFEICFKRISGDSNRPLVEKGYDYLEKLYQEREKNYAACENRLLPQQLDTISTPTDLLQMVGK